MRKIYVYIQYIELQLSLAATVEAFFNLFRSERKKLEIETRLAHVKLIFFIIISLGVASVA